VAGAVLTAPVCATEKAVADAAAVAAARQSLVGEWKLNKELSDDPRAKMREGRPEGGWGGGRGGGGRGGRGGGGWGGGGGRGGGGRGGATDPDRSGESGGSARGMRFTADKITITNLTPEITIVGPDGTLRTLHADNQGYQDSSGGTVKTRWDGTRLLIETKGDRGGMKEAWTVSATPRRLTVVMDVQRLSGGSVTIKRVFDPFQADTDASSIASPTATQPAASKP
jgi:hypothetical protein